MGAKTNSSKGVAALGWAALAVIALCVLAYTFA